jgi:phage I-like protein
MDENIVTDVTNQTADAELARLKAENEKFKGEIKTIAGTRDELKSKLKEIEDGKLIEDGKTKELLIEREKELAELKTQFETTKSKAEEYELYKKTKREGLLAELPDEESKTIASDLSLDKLELFVKKTKGTKPIDVDSGNAGGSLKLTDEQKADAERLGLSEKDYIEVMEHRNKNKKT